MYCTLVEMHLYGYSISPDLRYNWLLDVAGPKSRTLRRFQVPNFPGFFFFIVYFLGIGRRTVVGLKGDNSMPPKMSC